MNPRYLVRLTPEQRAACEEVRGDTSASKQTRRRATVLLHADGDVTDRGLTDREISAIAGVSPRTVARIRTAFARNGFEATLNGMPRGRTGAEKLTLDQELQLIALTRTPPPPGYPRWTTRTLADRARGLDGMPPISRELVRRVLKRHNELMFSGLLAFEVDALLPPVAWLLAEFAGRIASSI